MAELVEEFDMAKRTCSVDGCDRPHCARGLCSMHWKREHGKRTKYQRTCEVCDTTYLSDRPSGRFCSDECKGHAYRSTDVCDLPRRHPVMLLLNPPKPRRRPVVRLAECEWCGSEFSTTKQAQRMCSELCKIRAKRCRRRGRQAGSTSHYTWSEVMRLFLALGRTCAYCEQVIEKQPDPDHVVPLSRGGSNSMTNILPSCRACNSDKRDLLLDEWANDRERRGLPPVRTDIGRFTHLVISRAA